MVAAMAFPTIWLASLPEFTPSWAQQSLGSPEEPEGSLMTVVDVTGGRSRNLVLAAMIFAVAMTFIDQTIVSIAAPQIQTRARSDEYRRAVGHQRLPLVVGRPVRLRRSAGGHGRATERWSTLGVIVFAGASAMCGLTPKGAVAEAWIVTFRVIQGAGGAIMFPAALAIVVQTFALRERGRALALFFGIAGGLTAVGPVLGGVPDPMDVAGHLLGEHPRRPHRPGPHRRVEARHRAPAGSAWTTGVWP